MSNQGLFRKPVYRSVGIPVDSYFRGPANDEPTSSSRRNKIYALLPSVVAQPGTDAGLRTDSLTQGRVRIMNRQNRPLGQNRHRRFIPATESLETRQVLSVYNPFSADSLWPYSTSSQQFNSRVAFVRHEYDQYVSDLKSLELKSKATPEQLLALRDDARAISSAASSADLSQPAAQNTAVAVSLQLDRSPLYGAAQNSGWGVVSARLSANLQSLDVPQPLIDQTLSDMRALADSAGVSAAQVQTFTNDFYNLRNAESSLPPNSYYHFEDPGLYYTQHLRGFFRGWGIGKVAAEAQLQRDLKSIQTENQAGPAGGAVLQRDAHLLEGLGAAVPSATNQQLDDAYLAAFAQGLPTSQVLLRLQSNLVTILGPAATAPRITAVDRLVADAPAFARATAAPSSGAQIIVEDVGTLVDGGGGQTLNPFKVTVH